MWHFYLVEMGLHILTERCTTNMYFLELVDLGMRIPATRVNDVQHMDLVDT